MGIGTVAVYSEADRGRLHVELADDAYLVGPGPSADSYLRGDRIVDVGPARGRRSDPSRVRIPRGERAVRQAGRGGGTRLDRPATGGDRGDGIEGRGAGAHAGCRSAHRPRDDGACGERGSGARRSGRDRIPGRGQGVRGRRREGTARRRVAGRRRARVRDRAARRRGLLREPDGVRREVPGRSTARRGPGPGGRARERDPSRRAGLHDPEAPSEARRGDAVAGRRRGAERADRLDRGGGSASGRLPIRRHDRGPAGAGRFVLLPRDEYPCPGGAHGHGSGDRNRHRPRAGARRRRRAVSR